MQNESDVEIITEGKTVTAYLKGEIDHHNAIGLRQKIDEAVSNRQPDILALDFSAVSFMDSSGIGLVMGRYRLIENSNCRLFVTNLSKHAYKIMQLSGLGKIATLQKRKDDTK
jgi:stage II sporulation protein AA (anti-sigma F factor antagonist)